MTFQSFKFLVFFPIVVVVYFAIPFRYRRIFLLIVSYYFYMCFKPEYVVILFVSTLLDYYLGLQISKCQEQRKRKKLLVLGTIHNIGLLACLKYLDFFNESLQFILNQVNIFYESAAIEILLPVGISYYILKKSSYLIDVYREPRDVEKKLITFALYVSFFPEIMAGPIDRAKKLIPQFYKKNEFDYKRVTDGLKLMAWGFFKKLVIADRLALYVNEVYNNPTQFEGLSLVMATVYFSFQVYCDFSGYSDIAIGIGKVMGFDLMENFNRPYFSKSIGEFWKRWHISLSTWLMDYLFLPIAYSTSRKIKSPRLMGVKAESWSYIIGSIITMFICGLWHGSQWTYIIWGAFHGFYLAFSFITRKIRGKIRKKLQIKKNSFILKLFRITVTFSFVTFAWIFFRADSISDAVYIITHLFSGWAVIFNIPGLLQALTFGLLKKELAVAAVSVLFMLFVHIVRKNDTIEQLISKQKAVLRWSIYLVMLLWILVFAESGGEDFIYFQF